jgi:hypothetical protein
MEQEVSMSSLALSRPTRSRIGFPLAIGLSIWLLAALAAGLAGTFSRGGPPVPLAAFAGIPVLAFLAALAASATFRRAVRSLDLRVLTAVQTTRLVGGVFVVLWALGKLPAGFALPAGVGDLLVGATAPLVARFVVPRLPAARRLYVAWTAFGIADLVVAVSSGVLHSASPVGIFAGPLATAMMGALPLSIIPTFLVPLAVILHVAALQVAFAGAAAGERG